MRCTPFDCVDVTPAELAERFGYAIAEADKALVAWSRLGRQMLRQLNEAHPRFRPSMAHYHRAIHHERNAIGTALHDDGLTRIPWWDRIADAVATNEGVRVCNAVLFEHDVERLKRHERRA